MKKLKFKENGKLFYSQLASVAAWVRSRLVCLFWPFCFCRFTLLPMYLRMECVCLNNHDKRWKAISSPQSDTIMPHTYSSLFFLSFSCWSAYLFLMKVLWVRWKTWMIRYDHIAKHYTSQASFSPPQVSYLKESAMAYHAFQKLK